MAGCVRPLNLAVTKATEDSEIERKDASGFLFETDGPKRI